MTPIKVKVTKEWTCKYCGRLEVSADPPPPRINGKHVCKFIEQGRFLRKYDPQENEHDQD